MNIQSINLFRLHQKNYIQNNSNNKQQKQFNTYPQINDFSNHFYVPFFGKKAEENAINDFLNDKNINEEKKAYLNFLLQNKNFIDAATAMNLEDLNKFINLCLYFSPFSEEILNGKFVVICDNHKKPIFDLNAIAEYNKKHPNEPKNLLQEFSTDALTSLFLNGLKSNQIRTLLDPIQISYTLDNDINIFSKINYEFTKISQDKLEELKNAPISDNVKNLFSFVSITAEDKKTLWDLTEIPYFNAVSKNLKEEDLLLFINAISINKDFFFEALKGNILFIDAATQKGIPIINLEKIAVYNSNHFFQQSILNKLLDNKLLEKTFQAITFYKKNNNKYPEYLYTRVESNELLPSYDENLKKEIYDKGLPEEVFSSCILFKNSLNKTEKNNSDSINPVIKEISSQINSILEKRKSLKQPKCVADYFHSPVKSKLEKGIVFNFNEEIPYFNYLMRNAQLEDLDFLVELKKQKPKLLEKVLNGKIKIQKKPLINIDALALGAGNLHKEINKKSLIMEIIKEISSYKEAFGEELKSIKYVIDDDNNSYIRLEFYEKNKISAFRVHTPKKLFPEKIKKILNRKNIKEILITIEE